MPSHGDKNKPIGIADITLRDEVALVVVTYLTTSGYATVEMTMEQAWAMVGLREGLMLH